MRDPYDVVGVPRGASLDEVRAAYRKACKTRHPDLGGSHEAMVELNAAYAFILNELKHGRQQSYAGSDSGGERAREQPRQERREQPREEPRASADWRDIERDIDEELENLRRASEQYEERIRAKRREAWDAGQPGQWAKLAWDDLFGFLVRIARSGLKGVALLVAALMGFGSLLIELNIVSALIVLGSLIGLATSVALKNDKGGLMSAALLLFGLMTIVLTPVRLAVFASPLTTLGVLVCLALIFKFAREGGRAGLMTGGVLTAYVLIVILSSARPPTPIEAPPVATIERPPVQIVRPTPAYTPPVAPMRPTPTATAAAIEPPTYRPTPALAPIPPAPMEERTLSASDGATLKFVNGVVYHLKVRTGRVTLLHASVGNIKAQTASNQDCANGFEFPAEEGTSVWRELSSAYVTCGGDAVMVAHILQ